MVWFACKNRNRLIAEIEVVCSAARRQFTSNEVLCLDDKFFCVFSVPKIKNRNKSFVVRNKTMSLENNKDLIVSKCHVSIFSYFA